MSVPNSSYIASSDNIFNHLELDSDRNATVLVMDLRKSTSMMLKASSSSYAAYLNGLLTRLISIVSENFGIFEKFTGDGFIALFMESLVGKSVLRAINTAQQCRFAFREFHSRNESIFSSIISDYGATFGIDFGQVHIRVSYGEKPPRL